jgi:hypothetical protein
MGPLLLRERACRHTLTRRVAYFYVPFTDDDSDIPAAGHPWVRRALVAPEPIGNEFGL